MFEVNIKPRRKKVWLSVSKPLFSAMTKAAIPPFSLGRRISQIIMSEPTCCLSTQFPPTFHSSTGCPITGRAGAPDNHNGLLVVLELPLEASTNAASTPHSVRNAPDFERPLPFHRAAICPTGQEEGS
jgi:hypothetical protein